MTAPLKRDLPIRPHPRVIRKRNARRLEVDEVKRSAELVYLVPERRRDEDLFPRRVLDLAPLSLCLRADRAIGLDEAIERDLQ